MALSAQIDKVGIKHDAILDYLIANPTLKRNEVAAVFGVTTSWLSTIIHSNAFQDLLKQRQDELFSAAVVQPIQSKLMGCAQIAVDRLMEVTQFETDAKVLTTVLDKTLANLGYGQRAVGIPVNQQNNITLNITKEELAGARALIGQVKQGGSPQSLLEQAVEGQFYLTAPETAEGED